MHGHDTFFVSAVGAAIKTAARLDTVADDFAAAMFAFRRQCVNSAFETIEIARDTGHHHFDWFVILVAANFASIHAHPFLAVKPPPLSPRQSSRSVECPEG